MSPEGLKAEMETMRDIEAEGEVAPRRTPVVVPPRVVAHTDRPLTPQQMAAALDVVSRPSPPSVPLQSPFQDDGEPF